MFRNWRALLIYDKKCLHLQNSWVLLTCAAAAKSLQLCPTLCDPIRWQPTRLPRPWDSPGKNTGVGCHFLLQWMKVKSESEVAQSCPMDCSLPGSSIHGIFQARVLEWGAIAFSVSGPYMELKVPKDKSYSLMVLLPLPSLKWPDFAKRKIFINDY